MQDTKNIRFSAHRMRRAIVEMTTDAGSGHPTSSLSATDLMAALFFGKRAFFRYDVNAPEAKENDRLVFSKGHAAPLLYALWAEAGGIEKEELATLRKFGSRLEGHPTRAFPFTEVPTGSLGQGLGVGMGEALALRTCGMKNEELKMKNKRKTQNARSDVKVRVSRAFSFLLSSTLYNTLPRVWVLLGDSELAEGSVWEAARIAAQYRLGNLIAIVDANRLGQRGETMDGWDTEKIANRFRAFGWRALCVDGHDMRAIARAYKKAIASKDIPTVIVAKTVKGKGVSFLENAEGWHGKALSRKECEKALLEIGGDDTYNNLQSRISNFQKNVKIVKTETRFLYPSSPARGEVSSFRDGGVGVSHAHYSLGDSVSTRSVYGKSLAEVAMGNEKIVALDAEVSNSTFSIDFAKVFPERFFEMYIAEQTMVSVATGMARRGYIPFVSTFSAFFSRAFDQLRMAQYAGVPLVCVGSHCGVSIGEDGASQMGLEDIAMFRTLLGSVVLYPSDASSMRACVRLASQQKGVTYIRSTRAEVPVLYDEEGDFVVGGSKTLRTSSRDVVTIVAAGITVHEALKAYEMLKQEGIPVRVIDAYSIKPIDTEAMQKAARETGCVIVVEDHFVQGGLGDAVREAILHGQKEMREKRQETRDRQQETGDRQQDEEENKEESLSYNLQPATCNLKIVSLAVRKMPKSGTPEQLLRYEEIDAEAIARRVRNEIRGIS